MHPAYVEDHPERMINVIKFEKKKLSFSFMLKPFLHLSIETNYQQIKYDAITVLNFSNLFLILENKKIMVMNKSELARP